MRFEGKTLEEVYQKASDYFQTSISELKIDILQNPSKGFFGFFAKNAIIEVYKELDNRNSVSVSEESKIELDSNIEKKSDEKVLEESEFLNLDIEEVIKIVKPEIEKLFKDSCFNLDTFEVKIYDDETILFKLDGEDAALLIGKEGYRYNALSTLIFNWIYQKYGYRTRLEVASFLENQEEMMRKFLEPIMREIEEKGRVRTKPFNGVLAYIAVEILRAEFPHKYVAIKKNKDGENYIIVNDFLNG